MNINTPVIGRGDSKRSEGSPRSHSEGMAESGQNFPSCATTRPRGLLSRPLPGFLSVPSAEVHVAQPYSPEGDTR